MKQVLTRRAIDALWYTLENAKGVQVKRATKTAIVTIDDALDVARVPKRSRNLANGEMVELPESGLGYDDYDFAKAGIDLDVGTAGVLKGLYDSIIDGEGDGYPRKMARAVDELEQALVKWTAKVADPKKK